MTGTELGLHFIQIMVMLMIAQWISTSSLGVYPPMSRGVFALMELICFGFSGASIVSLFFY
ncbi:hypothetical protein ACQKFM_13550 [Paenibacillus xylanexedens]|uniref:hypothetical protein n=1 Tax=Paenibacillus xylanexedens TaxID=528191 RepID=UPI003CFC691E